MAQPFATSFKTLNPILATNDRWPWSSSGTTSEEDLSKFPEKKKVGRPSKMSIKHSN